MWRLDIIVVLPFQVYRNFEDCHLQWTLNILELCGVVSHVMTGAWSFLSLGCVNTLIYVTIMVLSVKTLLWRTTWCNLHRERTIYSYNMSNLQLSSSQSILCMKDSASVESHFSFSLKRTVVRPSRQWEKGCQGNKLSSHRNVLLIDNPKKKCLHNCFNNLPVAELCLMRN